MDQLLSNGASLLSILVAVFIATMGAVWSLAIWLTGKFYEIRHLMFDKIDSSNKDFMEKLEYHERHDDARFAEVRNDLWELKIRNAASGHFKQNESVQSFLEREDGKRPQT